MKKYSTIEGVTLRGVSATLPNNMVYNKDINIDVTEKKKRKIIESIGIEARYIVPNEECASDLCLFSAEKLLLESGVNKNDIGVLVFVSQTPDYVLPSTSQLLQSRLGLPKTVLAFDVNLGCSGFTYGLTIVSSIMNSLKIKYGLILAGDTISKIVDCSDRSTALLFSDAGSAALLERTGSNKDLVNIDFGTNGEGGTNLIVEDGLAKSGYKNKPTLYMNGAEIYNFATNDVCSSLSDFMRHLSDQGLTPDYYLFHQANIFLLKTLQTKLGVSSDKFYNNIQKFGNTSSASIPLLLCDLKRQLSSKNHSLLMSGFGVGYSWCSVLLNLSKETTITEVQYYG